MSMTLIFWILMLLWLVFSVAQQWGPLGPYPWGNNVFLFVLFLLLGWQVFGAPVK